jgi:putative NADH-flavin reductase
LSVPMDNWGLGAQRSCWPTGRRSEQASATTRAGQLEALGADVVLMDVTDADQRRRALTGVDVVIASANAVLPRDSTAGWRTSSPKRWKQVSHESSCPRCP